MFKRCEELLIIAIALFLTGCAEWQENKLIKQQAVTFENEISYRQRKEIELENKIKKKQEEIDSLKLQLECKKGE